MIVLGEIGLDGSHERIRLPETDDSVRGAIRIACLRRTVAVEPDAILRWE